MNSSLPRRPQASLDYERRPRASPDPRRMSSPSHDDPYSARYTTQWGSDPYREYQRAPSPGVYDRYRDVSVDISWNKTTTWYHPRDYTHDGYSGRERRDSNGSATSRTFEPSSSWKQSNGVRDHERNEYPPLERYSAGGSPRNYDRGNYYAKDSWPPSTPAYSQERPYTKDYRSPERPGRVSDSYRSAGSSHSLETRSRKPRSPFRSPRRHYRSRSRSRSRSSSRSFSRSRSPPAKRSMLPTNRFDSDRYQDASASKPLPRIPTGPRLNRTTTNPSSSGKEKTPSRSPSQSSSIASSRETSVKPSERISDQNDDKAWDVPVTWNHPPSPAGESNILCTNENEKQDSTPLVDSVSAPAVTQVASVSQNETPLSVQASRPVSDVPEPAPPVLPDPVITTPRDPIAEPLPPNDDHSIHPRDIPDYTFEDIPDLSNASNVRDAVRVTIMRRLLSDRQTRQELVEPVLYSNLSMPKTDIEEPAENRSIHALMTELTHPDSDRLKARMETSNRLQHSLVERFKERQHDLKTKVQRLTEEYIALHEKWKVHCAMLDRQVKAKSDARTADVKVVPINVVPPPPMSGRTTRRSAASLGLGLGDAVRSDLEMEQIIASIGSNEATDPNQLCLRNVAVIPDMISVIKGKVDYVYDDNNLRVEDPVSYYATQSGIHDWTEEEKQIFVDKYAIFPKQFGAISRFLPNKTTAQCVDFYYLHKNVDIDFRALTSKNLGRKGRRRTAKRKTNALLADIRLHDAEVSAAGSANTRSGKGRTRRAATSVPVLHITLPILEPRKSSLRKPVSRLETPTTATPTPEPEARPKRRRVASARLSLGTVQTETEEDLQIPEPKLEPELEPEVEPEPEPEAEPEPEPEARPEPELEVEPRPAKKPRRNGRRVKSAATVSDDLLEDGGDTETADSISIARQKVNSEWKREEKELFLKYLGQFGFDFLRVALGVETKSAVQCSDYYRVNEVPLGLRKVAENAFKGTPSDASEPAETSGDGSTTPVTSSVPAYTTGAPPYPDMAAYFSHPGFQRYTTGISPYGAPSQALSSLYAGQLYTNFGYLPTGTAPGATPYAANTAAYIPYPYPYQTGPVAIPTQSPTATETATTPQTTNTVAQPYYPGYTA